MPFIEKILETLQFQAEVTLDLLDSFIGDKHTSYRKMRRSTQYGPRGFKSDWADVYKKRRQFYNLLNHLKNEGLVKNKKTGRTSLWKITKRGVERLKFIKKRKENPFSAYNINYQNKGGPAFTIISFDIPEKEKNKRVWLRASLVAMDFSFLQKSVWVGRGKVDEEFIRDLRKNGVLDCVHIFSVNSHGTIREM